MALRSSPRRVVKTLFFLSLFGFILINLNLLLDDSGSTGSSDASRDGADGGAGDSTAQKAGGANGRKDPINYVPRFGLHGVNGGHDAEKAGEGGGGSEKDILKPVQGEKAPSNNQQQHQSQNANNGDDFDIMKVLKYSNTHPSNRTRGGVASGNSSYTVVTGGFVTDDRVPYVPIGDNPEAIKAYIAAANKQQHIRNLDRFDLPTGENSFVIVVQVHNRTDYLRLLLDSLRSARHIENALLVFSQDYFSDDVNQLISEVDFCLVMQIFYPIPIQLHPHEFPGEDPGDCPRDSNREQAAVLGCNNAQWPDKYGHYREAKYTQTKHHWFWKANHVFDHMQVTKHFNGPILFVEEDHMVTDDFLHVLQRMYRFRDIGCKDCSIMTLGTYLKQPVYGAFSKKGFWERIFGSETDKPKYDGVDIMNWISSKHNMGMSFNRQVWESIKACSEAFCRFDDYNWDWSLQYVSMSCLESKLRVICMKSPRIYHIGECGVHHKGKNCDPAGRVAAIQKLLTDNRQHLFPDQLEIAGYPRTPTKMPKPNGGWGDRRDHELCLKFTSPDLHS